MTETLIITATKDRPGFLRETVQNVQQQTYGSYRHIIVNNGDIADVKRAVGAIALNDCRIMIVSFTDAVSSAQTRNFGLNFIDKETKFIKFLDDDDVFESEESLELLVNSLRKDESIGFVYGIQRRVNKEGEFINLTDQGPLGLAYVLANSSFPFTTTLFRREFLLKLGGMSDWVSCEDLELVCRAFVLCAEQGLKAEYVDEVVARYRKHDGGKLSNNRKTGEKERATLRMQQKFALLQSLVEREAG